MSRSRLLWGVLLVLYAGAIFALSSLSAAGERPLVPIRYGDKLFHGGEFLVFFLLCWKTLPRRRIVYSLILTGIYAGSDELHQLFVATRAADFFDWLADVAGGALGALAVYLLVNLRLPTESRLRILGGSEPDKEA